MDRVDTDRPGMTATLWACDVQRFMFPKLLGERATGARLASAMYNNNPSNIHPRNR